MNLTYWFLFRQLCRASVLAIFLSMTACGSPPPAKPSAPQAPVVAPTEVSIQIDTSPKVNPNAQGRPSPIFVRVYRLKNSVNFLAADYFNLVQKDQTVLGSDILFREEVMLNPGQSHVLQKKWLSEPGYFAVVAAFRDLDKSVWRVIQPLNIQTSYVGDNSTGQTIRIILDSRSIVVQ
jgi:type VI secretion system protein VasD